MFGTQQRRLRRGALALALLAFVACNTKNDSKTTLVKASAAVGNTLYSAEVLAETTWGNGYNGIVRVTNLAGAPITNFKVSFKVPTGNSITATGWNGTVTATTTPLLYTATAPSSLSTSPVAVSASHDVGFTATGTYGASTVEYLEVNGATVYGTAPDITAPKVSLSMSPVVLQAAGNVTLTAAATDNKGIAKVEFYRVIGTGTTATTSLVSIDTASPYTQVFGFKTASQNGSYTYNAKAYDTSGNTAVSSNATYTVALPVTTGSDTTAPVVNLTANVNPVTTGPVKLTAATTDAVGAKKVEFYRVVGAVPSLIYTDNVAPFELPFNFSYAQNGAYNYKAQAYDAAGNVGFSNTLALTVSLPKPTNTIKPTLTLGEFCPDYKAMYLERTFMDFFPGESMTSSHGGNGAGTSVLSDYQKAVKYGVAIDTVKSKASSGNFAQITFADLGTEAIKHANAYHDADYPDKATCQLLPRLMILGTNDIEAPVFHVSAGAPWAEVAALKSATVVGKVTPGISTDARTYVPAEADERDRCHNQPRIENNVGWTATGAPVDRLNENNPVLAAISNRAHPTSGAALGAGFSANAPMQAEIRMLQETSNFWYLALVIKNTGVVPQNLNCAVVWFVAPSSWASDLRNGHYNNVHRPAPGFGHPQRDILEVVYDASKELSAYMMRIDFHDEPNNMRVAYPNQYWALEIGMPAEGKLKSGPRYATSAERQAILNTVQSSLHIELESNLNRNDTLLNKLGLRNRVTN